MKIAFDQQIFNLQAYGGISRYYAKLSEELLALNEDVKIFAGLYINNYLPDVPAQLVKGIKVNKYPSRLVKIIEKSNKLWVDRSIQSWQPNILHETYYTNKYSKSNGLIRFTTVYDMIHELYSNSYSKDDPISNLKKSTFQRADHIISISHSTKKDLVELFQIDPDKISVVHLAADLFAASDDNITSPPSKPFLLYVGQRSGYKNFEGFLKAVAASSSLQSDFDIVAFGSSGFTAEEVSLIQSLGFKDNQVRHRKGADEVLVELYRTATAFVYPSLYEGFGLPPLEAMGYKCPIISSNTSSMPEVIEDAGEFFNPHEVDSITHAIENTVYAPSRIAELQTKGTARLAHFSWQKCAAETLEIYKGKFNSK